MKQVAKVTAQFDNCRILKDGGGKITFEFGNDSLKEIQKIQEWNGKGEINFILAVTPYLDTFNARHQENITEDL